MTLKQFLILRDSWSSLIIFAKPEIEKRKWESGESSQVFYRLLDILKFDNIVKLSTCLLAHKILNKYSSIPFLFYDSLRTVSSLHKYNARYASKGISSTKSKI